MTDTLEDRALLEVHFTDLHTNDTATFAVPGEVELVRAWAMAYDELGETRRPADTLESADGEDMTPFLGETVREVQHRRVRDLRFQIRGGTGGADR